MEHWEEYKMIRPFWSWVILTAFCAAIIAWGLAVYWLIPQNPRYFDFGALPDTPSQSVYSTDRPVPQANPPLQIPALPEAQTQPAGTPTGSAASTQGSQS